MASRLNPYVGFTGDARHALEFYQDVYGGELSLNTRGDFGQYFCGIHRLSEISAATPRVTKAWCDTGYRTPPGSGAARPCAERNTGSARRPVQGRPGDLPTLRNLGGPLSSASSTAPSSVPSTTTSAASRPPRHHPGVRRPAHRTPVPTGCGHGRAVIMKHYPAEFEADAVARSAASDRAVPSSSLWSWAEPLAGRAWTK